VKQFDDTSYNSPLNYIYFFVILEIFSQHFPLLILSSSLTISLSYIAPEIPLYVF